MLPDRRAVIFDMDDTLYAYRRFVLSGFVAVAAYLERSWRVDRRRALKVLVRAARGPERGRELQACMAAFGLPAALLHPLVSIMRSHTPTIRLRRPTIVALTTLRSAGWRLGVLTNGPRSIQASKASALGVARYVDTIVYATEHGSGAGKPDPEPFSEVLGRLRVPARAAVFVGDDETCDVFGAARAGLSTIRWAVGRRAGDVSKADAIAGRWSVLPSTAERLILEAAERHAA